MSRKEDNNDAKEDDVMMTGTAIKMDSSLFNQFLQLNKEKIDSVVPKNPSIDKNDEWRQENFWEENAKRSSN